MLIVDEAVTNAMEHGNRWNEDKSVSVSVWADSSCLHIAVEDQRNCDRRRIKTPYRRILDAQLAKVARTTRERAIGQMRLAWWNDVIDDPAGGWKFDATKGVLKRQYGSQYAGVCHTALPQKGHTRPGEVLLGTDSHTCMAGAFNQFATGIAASGNANCAQPSAANLTDGTTGSGAVVQAASPAISSRLEVVTGAESSSVTSKSTSLSARECPRATEPKRAFDTSAFPAFKCGRPRSLSLSSTLSFLGDAGECAPSASMRP
mgnify:CR=1 FL=1